MYLIFFTVTWVVLTQVGYLPAPRFSPNLHIGIFAALVAFRVLIFWLQRRARLLALKGLLERYIATYYEKTLYIEPGAAMEVTEKLLGADWRVEEFPELYEPGIGTKISAAQGDFATIGMGIFVAVNLARFGAHAAKSIVKKQWENFKKGKERVRMEKEIKGMYDSINDSFVFLVWFLILFPLFWYLISHPEVFNGILAG
jgi:membrane protein implicated in regulation of membrane protease activity